MDEMQFIADKLEDMLIPALDAMKREIDEWEPAPCPPRKEFQ